MKRKTKAQIAAERVTWTREAIHADLSAYRGKARRILSPKASCADLLTFYPTTDLHLGMLTWGKETGTSWDLKIASETILRAFGNLLASTPASHTAALIDFGDYLHANDQRNATPTSGHQLDVDGRFPKIIKEAARIRREMIEMALQKHKRVIYRGLPGNHDPEAAQWISLSMALFFERNPRVVIDTAPADFWFYRHGVCMLAANHGHKTRAKLLPAIMAAYEPAMWGATEFRYGFSGHIHHETSGEDGGAIWETLRTPAPRDAFAHQHGYAAGRGLVAITYHSSLGERVRHTEPICKPSRSSPSPRLQQSRA